MNYHVEKIVKHVSLIEPPRPVEGGDSQTKKYIVYYFGNFTAP